MTNQELNRDIKRLAKGIAKAEGTCKPNEANKAFYDYVDSIAKPEFIRLYHADDKFKTMTKASVLIMLRLNLRYRFVALHTFGINIALQS